MIRHSITNVRAISFDLDDTLYDNQPVIRNAFHALYTYLVDLFPKVASKYDFDAFHNAAIMLKKQRPMEADLSKLRRVHINQILTNCGYCDAVNSTINDEAFNVFWQARQEVTLYPQVLTVLKYLSAKMPLITISNGNACPQCIGIGQYFQHTINATDTGKAKPDSSMFLLACNKLAIAPVQLLHVGDNTQLDIKGATNAGCRSIWFNRLSLSDQNHQADIVIEDLSELLAIDFR